ncbi:ribosomal maturation YjgA family protein [Flavicella sediminum]|uniref:ribosomal maturation YjgA family protein n=1 Tax=Flavicella sediminum TaxID=2585141 RepID=UPI001121605F|nr:DUF2809 domain-containing protein [Flavicella sediminum]
MKFNKSYLFISLVLLLIEILIALTIHDRFIRPFVGDVLSVILLFSLARIFYTGKGFYVSIGVLLFAFLVEFSQYFKLAEVLGFSKGSFGHVVLGANFDPLDLLAYSLGIFISSYFDRKIIN